MGFGNLDRLLLGVPGLHTVYVLLAASWLIWCHRSNIKRLLTGTENKFKFHVNKDESK